MTGSSAAQRAVNRSYDEVDYEIADGVAVITLDAPQRRNGMRVQMLVDALHALDRADRDPDVRAVIVTGAGESFSVGADLDGPETLSRALVEDVDGHTPTGYREPAGRISERLFSMCKPVIAALNGHAIGGGATIAAAMDIRIASENARFGFVFTQRGVVPEGASSWFLPRLVGLGRAADWLLTGRVFDAAEAYEAGFLTKVVPADQVMSVAHEYARLFARDTSPTSVALSKRLLSSAWLHSHPGPAAAQESRIYAGRVDSDDAREGVMSFLERRPAVFPPLDPSPAQRF
ncbi:putative enoyl-CoA hydratase [Gordonia terrae NBRC 100016]|uniref:Enoyl-CoA hydratase n=1 Tax=Gordonia terrae NBRC 100016 TaxID=1089454 RepID=A0ABQ0HJV6_9ACTN|nr:enoyl-CoA hydratase [Gordonia terrae]GAB46164.1 putative enoyl-CoA hydratase [Gordonia terrae NBRC 100016]VTR10529.1 Enoyl-CoA hydratase/carnithine racemase [Clostridioides difficile]VTS57320.1 Probable enoyl-CoA hydratase echA8 [Gordonia terrae]